MKEKWLQYHARKTEGVLSICPLCYGMPLRITNGNGYLSKLYGMHNGATCVLDGWQLAEPDIATSEENKESQIVLSSLPVKLIVQMDRPLKQTYKGLPENCFPLSPVTVYWTLDAEEQIEISRRGFPVVPNFSTTIDGATGRTLDTGIADLGDLSVAPSFTRAMKGYIALSRFKKAHDFFLAQPFSPAFVQPR